MFRDIVVDVVTLWAVLIFVVNRCDGNNLTGVLLAFW